MAIASDEVREILQAGKQQVLGACQKPTDFKLSKIDSASCDFHRKGSSFFRKWYRVDQDELVNQTIRRLCRRCTSHG